MKRNLILAVLVAWVGTIACAEEPQQKAIAFSQLGEAAGAQYAGDGLKITAVESGARIACLFQRLEGEVTEDGLALRSTSEAEGGGAVVLRAAAVGRTPGEDMRGLPDKGSVRVSDGVAQWLRPGLVEEYRVGMDGVRQDFVVMERPEGEGALRLELALSGATARTAAEGASLVLNGSGRELAYHTIKVTDANDRELAGRIEVASASRLAVVVEDSGAVYPIRIDPTFSDANWVSMGGVCGANNSIIAFVKDSSGNIYAGGTFTAVGDLKANRIAKWNGSAWSALGLGMNADVRTLAMDGAGNLYAAGYFTNAGGVAANYIAKWNGSAWSALGSGMNNFVDSLATDSVGNLFAGGSFTSAGGNAANYIAKWNGSAWSALGSGMNHRPLALTVDSTGNLFAGGLFTTAGGNAASRIAKWNGSAWSALGSGIDSSVYSLTLDSSGNLYVGGNFTMAGGSAANCIAKWNGSAWSALGSGVSDTVNALTMNGTNLVAGGSFKTAGGNTVNRVAKWNGSAWSALGSGINSSVYALTMDSSGNLYAGGMFTTAGGNAANRVAKWNGSVWSTLGSGMGGNYIYALATDSAGNLYAGGDITMAGGSAVNRIAKWNGSAWSALGSGLDSTVYALATDGAGNLYAGGDFTTAGGSAANYIAKWNGSAWSALGSGMNQYGTVQALALDGAGNLYAGGAFTTAGGGAANRVAKWNGSVWSTLGSGIDNNSVYVLKTDGTGNLYAGGYFTTAGGNAVNNIAKWNGSAWSALGSGMDTYGYVKALAMDSAGNLYVGGWFTNAGGVALSRIAKWNGSAWSTLGSGVSDFVEALALDGAGNLYAGGNFTNASGVAANRVAKWNGSAWSALGSGVNSTVEALALDNAGNLYAGGGLTIAGTNVSGYVAKAFPDTPVASAATAITTSGFYANWYAGFGATNYFLDVATNSGFTSYVSGYQNLSAGNVQTKPVTGLSAGQTYYYRVRAQNSGGTSGNSGTITVTLNKADQVITFPTIGDKLTTDAVGLAATASSGLSVSFAVGSGPATISGGTNLSFSGAGSVSIVASQAGNGNWNAAPNFTNTFTVTKAAATVTLGSLSQTYNGAARLATATTVPGSLTVDFTYNGSATAPTNAGSYAMTGTVNSAMYQGSTNSTLVVSKAELTVAGAVAQDKPYDGNADAVIAGATLVGVVGTEDVELDALTGRFAQTGFGTDIAVTGTLTLKGADAGNYALTQPSDLAADIFKAELTVTGAVAQDKPYDGNANAVISGATLVGVVGLEDVALANATTGTFAQVGVGTDIAVATAPMTITGDDIGNYTLTQPTGLKADITPALATVELLNLTGQVYDGTPKTVFVATDPEGLTVDVTYDGNSTAPIAAGSYAVTGTVTEVNYEGSASGTLVIDQADQSISDFLPADASHFYQSDAVDLSATASSGAGVTFTVLSGPGHIEGARLTFTGLGEVQVVASQSGDGNYNPAPAVTHTYMVHEDLALKVSRTAVNVREAGEGRFFVRMAAAPIVKTTVTVSRIDGDASLVLKSGATLVFKPSNWSVWQTVTLGQAADDGNSINEQATFAVSMVGEEDQLVVATALDDDGLGSNLALATAGSAIAGSYAARAIDGVHTSSANYGYTVWTNVPPGTMVLDLKDAATVARIRLLNWDWSYRVHQYKIEKSLDGAVWTPLVVSGAGAQRGWDDWAVANESIRYLKFTGLSNSVNTSVCIPEWEVYGIPALKPAPVVGKAAVNVRENGEGRLFVKLARKPGASTLVTVAPGEGGDADLTVKSGGTLTFTPANWSVWQVVTLAAADDMDAANGTATINVSYSGSAVAEVTATELDDDIGPNLALTSAGSAITGGRYAASTIDGVHTSSVNFGYTTWTNVPPGTMTLDLKSTATVSRVRLLNWDWTYRVHRYKIESSTDGSIWSTLVDAGAGEHQGWEDWPVADVSIGYLRFTGLTNSINPAVCIAEWEVYGSAPGRRSLASAKTSTRAQESEPVAVLTSAGPEDQSGWNAVDGDAETAWVGQKDGGGYLVVEYRPALKLSALEVDLAEGSPTNVQILYSLDAKDWQPLPEDMAVHPVSLNFLWLLFPDDGTGSAPGVLEIHPNP